MNQNKENIAAIILAAGTSKRMGDENKLLKIWNSKPLVTHVCTAALESTCSTVVLVSGYQSDQIQKIVDQPGLNIVHNCEFASGMASSIVAGVEFAISRNVTQLIILLGDMPQITSSMISKLITASREHPGKIIAASCVGKRGNPVLWPSAYFENLLRLEGDTGAKDLLANAGGELITIELGVAARFDLDTPDAFVNKS